ncbi:putative cell division repressor domain protein [Escherichia coli 2-474-04_S1_C2]|nr:putative cell division repressor domain protein [Escherichia coli 2-156-04_S1_C3]KDY99630.1 putative cell division repressor domain protein [Escherichia coli 2-474-04_S1_C2]
MARSCVTDPRWRELVALYRYDWIAAADVLFGKTPTWQQDLIIESVQEQGSKTSVSSGHGTGKSDMTSIMIMLFIIMYPGARAIIVANKIQQVMTGIFKYIKINWATATSRFPWLADYFVLTETAFYEVTGKGVWTVVPKGFRLGSEEALAGEHADHLLYIIDEASGVSDRAFGIITGALTGQDNRILLLSQPTRPSQRLRRLPIWLLSLPQLILNLSAAFTPAKNVTITSLLHQQKMRPALSFLTPHVFSLPVFPLIHAILSVTGASLLTLLLRRDYENVISHP